MGKRKTAGVFLINKEKKVLVCHPSKHADNLWSVTKGGVEKDESDLDAAIRETYEEANIVLKNTDNIHYLGELTNKKRIFNAFVIFEWENNYSFKDFDLKCNSYVPLEIGSYPEMDDYKWISISMAKNILPAIQIEFLEMIEKMLNHENTRN